MISLVFEVVRDPGHDPYFKSVGPAIRLLYQLSYGIIISFYLKTTFVIPLVFEVVCDPGHDPFIKSVGPAFRLLYQLSYGIFQFVGLAVAFSVIAMQK